MRTIKFLGIAVALAAVSVSAHAQGGRRFDRSTGVNDLARLEARQIERHQMRRFMMARAQRMDQVAGMRRGAMQRGAMQRGAMQRAFEGGQRKGMQLGVRAGFRAGARAGMRANATPEQAALAKRFSDQRQAIRAKVQAGTLTREQARTQMKAWVAEHRPKK